MGVTGHASWSDSPVMAVADRLGTFDPGRMEQLFHHAVVLARLDSDTVLAIVLTLPN